MTEKNRFTKKYERIKDELDIKLYDKVLELRRFEIENFWKRTLFFWGTIAFIYAGYFNANLKNYQIVIPLIGLLFNIIFSFSIRGSKYWQEHWEEMAVIYENELNFILFKNDTQSIVNENSKSIFTKPYRFSVSKLTMLLSDLSVLLWFILWVQQMVSLFELKKIQFSFRIENTILHPFTIGVVIIHIVLIGYFVLFLRNGEVYHKFKEKK